MRSIGPSLVLLGMLQVGSAWGEVTLGVGIEYFDWREDVTPKVEETGPLLAFHIGATQDKSQGFLLGAKGRLWSGSVNYDGAELRAPHRPLQSTTNYTGAGGEGQLRYRGEIGPHHLDLILGAGLDVWQRKLSSSQSEDYVVLSARLGLELAPAGGERGLLAGLGVRYPYYVREDAHFNDLGASNNPILKPKGEVSLTAHLGFVLDKRWRLIAYYEAIYLKSSPTEQVNFGPSSSLPSGLYYQPTSHMDVVGLRLEYRL